MSGRKKGETTTLTGLGQSSRVAAAYKELVRYIHKRGLGPGRRLPCQEDLRNELGYSHHSLSAAMGLLAEGGVLRRKPKVGTIVEDPDATARGVWTVGLITQPQEVLEVPFFAVLVNLLQSELIRLGCRVHMYPNAAGCPSDRLEQFPGLPAEIEAGRVDGVLATVSLLGEDVERAREQGVVLVKVGPPGTPQNGVCIDQARMVQTATESLVEDGCSRLALVTNFKPRSGPNGPWQRFCETLDAQPGAQTGESLHEGNGPRAGIEVARQLLGRPENKRPDGLIIADDRIAMGLTAELAKAGNYRPRIAVQTNLQVPLAFALPVDRYCVDIEDMAGLGAEKMLRQLRNPSLPEEVTWVEPERESGERKSE